MRARTDPTGWLACMVAMRIPGDANRRHCIRCRAGSHADVRYCMRIPMERHVTCSGIWYAQARPLMQPAALSVSSALQA